LGSCLSFSAGGDRTPARAPGRGEHAREPAVAGPLYQELVEAPAGLRFTLSIGELVAL